MAFLRVGVVLGGFWAFQIFLLNGVPAASAILDPLLMLIVFFGLHSSSTRYLWIRTALIGFLKDLSTGGYFGAAACSFALVGWVLGAGHHLVEREDPVIQGVWVGLMVGLNMVFHGLLIMLADSVVGWNRWWITAVPIAMIAHGVGAVWFFPFLRRFLKMQGRPFGIRRASFSAL